MIEILNLNRSVLTCFPSHLLYGFHSAKPGLQYSNVYSSAYSSPRPWPNRPWVCTPVIMCTLSKLTCSHSRTPCSTGGLGHQPPPARSTFNLWTDQTFNNNIFYMLFMYGCMYNMDIYQVSFKYIVKWLPTITRGGF